MSEKPVHPRGGRPHGLALALGALGLIFVAGVVLVAIARLTSHAIDGIQCSFGEATTYHVHAHLTLVTDGRVTFPPAGVGIHYEHLCLYWLHTHDASGVIHIEAPRRIAPTLRNFFDIWGEPLTRSDVGPFRVGRGQSVRGYVGKRLYPGDPGVIKLFNHTAVTLEIGPPFEPPPAANFEGL